MTHHSSEQRHVQHRDLPLLPVQPHLQLLPLPSLLLQPVLVLSLEVLELGYLDIHCVNFLAD
jgi:hypothetical protein